MFIYWKEFILAILIAAIYIYFDVRKKKKEAIQKYTKIKKVETNINDIIKESNELLVVILDLSDNID